MDHFLRIKTPTDPFVSFMSSSQVDSIVQAILDKFIARSVFGKKKYGTDLDRQDLSLLDWIQHAQEEHMDAILYLEKLKRTISPSVHCVLPPPPVPASSPSSEP